MKKNFNEVAAVFGYHVHIYFEPGKVSETTARELVEELKSRFGDDVDSAAKIGKIGPHTAPNFAVHITKKGFTDIVSWTQLNANGLSILIHPETGDELKDHLDSSMWIGKPMEYNDAFFNQFKRPKFG